jgi:arylsulfatase A-like enzyme
MQLPGNIEWKGNTVKLRSAGLFAIGPSGTLRPAIALRQSDFWSNGLSTFREFLQPFMLIACVFVSSSALAQSGQPNIIVILADDLGYGDVGFNGCPDYPTPNIDSLTINGVRCSSGYVTHPFCSPSRAALLTGRYQQRFGHENQPDLRDPFQAPDTANPRLGLPMQELLLPQILKPAGYVCGAVGKWHLGLAPNFHPTQRGFDEFFGFLGGRSPYYNASLLRGTTQITERAYLTDAFTREAVSFINRHATEPFFLYLAYNAVHSPYDTPPQNYMDRVANITDPSRRTYAAIATALDDGVGQVLQALQGQNLLSNTLIFFLSDNGGENNNRARNYPLRGYKFNVLEGGIHVPFAVQWTGRLPGHSVYNEPISSLDIVATAAAAAGVQLPADRVYDGLNVIPYLAGQQISPQRTLFWRWFGLGASGPPADPFGAPGILGGSPGTIWAVRSGVLKLVAARGTLSQPASLYNLQTDIGETQNLAGARSGDVDTLKSLYNQWNSETIPPLWLDNVDPKILPLVLTGDWNGYNQGDTTFPWRLTRITAPGVEGTPDAFNWFTNTIHVATTGGDTTPGLHSFALVGGNSYSKQWGGVTINVDGTTSVPFFSGSVLAPTNSISLQDGYYYSFRILDWSNQIGAGMKLAVMKTSAPPILVRLNGRHQQGRRLTIPSRSVFSQINRNL